MRALLQGEQPSDSLASTVLQLCRQSAAEDEAYLAVPLDGGSALELEVTDTAAALDKAVHELVNSRLTSYGQAGEMAGALSKYLEQVGPDRHDALVRAGLVKIWELLAGG